MTLPAAAGNSGKVFSIKKTDSTTANVITVSRAGSDTIDGQTVLKLGTQYDQLVIVSDGSTKWNILNYGITTGASFTNASHTTTVNTSTKIAFASGDLDYDPLSMFDDSNDRWTAPIAGKYLLVGSLRYPTATASSIRAFFKVNGSGPIFTGSMLSNTSNVSAISISQVANLAAGDYVELWGYSDASIISGDSQVSVTRLSN